MHYNNITKPTNTRSSPHESHMHQMYTNNYNQTHYSDMLQNLASLNDSKETMVLFDQLNQSGELMIIPVTKSKQIAGNKDINHL